MIATFWRENDEKEQWLLDEFVTNMNRNLASTTVEYSTLASVDELLPEAMARDTPTMFMQGAPDASVNFQEYEKTVLEKSRSKRIEAYDDMFMGTVALVALLAPANAQMKTRVPSLNGTLELERWVMTSELILSLYFEANASVFVGIIGFENELWAKMAEVIALCVFSSLLILTP
jgi:hypothetical protein